MPSFTAALLQMCSSANLNENLARAADLLDEAAAGGAALAALPEMWPCMSGNDSHKLACAEQQGSGPVQSLLSAKAAQHRMHVCGGSLLLRGARGSKPRNSCLLHGPDGRLIARYDKIHLFRFLADDRSYDETGLLEPGQAPVFADTALGRIGLAVCYDLRFPELFRKLAEPDMIIAPSAFTMQTGLAHWELLVRTRAVENLCHVLAPAQCGKHEGGLRSWGHSTAVSPWGAILADAGDRPGVAFAKINLDDAVAARAKLPALANRML